jgi:iron(III) transport system ATP-binding protein
LRGSVSAIGIRGLSKRYGHVAAVDGIDLEVNEGEFVSLLGPSGCGKTTILRCVAGLERPDEGEIRIGERVVVDSGRGVFVPPHKRGIGMVFQSYALWPHMTVFGNVAYPLRAQRRARAEVAARVGDALRIVGLGEHGSRAASALSGGQQQRVALARALASEPSVMLLDEPLSNLDAGLRAQLRHEIRRIHRQVGTTSLYVTHDQVEAIMLSDRILVINGGHVEQVGRPRDILLAPANRWVAGFVGFENFLPGVVAEVDGDHVTVSPDRWDVPLHCQSTGSDALAPGDAVELAIRASNVDRGADRGANVFAATVRDVNYLGDVVEYELAVPSGPLVVRMPEREAANIGDRIGATAEFSIAPEHVVPLRVAPVVRRAEPPVVARV